ncbi:hypothetical protein STENM327S_04036 [Streptomyces tendae]
MTAWLRGGIAGYADRHDDLAGDATSRLSPDLHLGALSPVELVHRARREGGPGAEAFVRQLAWRDFHHQVLAARPHASAVDYRTRHDRWRTGADAEADVTAWKEGRTGYPVVDAAMRQLRHEGWMHNRGRLLVASFLTKALYVDWRVGARHFLELLVDGDVANNQLNWQSAAGTGTDTRPHRVLNPLTQARRFDPDGAYVRRWVPEPSGSAGRSVHEPWAAAGGGALRLRRLSRPDPSASPRVWTVSGGPADATEPGRADPGGRQVRGPSGRDVWSGWFRVRRASFSSASYRCLRPWAGRHRPPAPGPGDAPGSCVPGPRPDGSRAVRAGDDVRRRIPVRRAPPARRVPRGGPAAWRPRRYEVGVRGQPGSAGLSQAIGGAAGALGRPGRLAESEGLVVCPPRGPLGSPVRASRRSSGGVPG